MANHWHQHTWNTMQVSNMQVDPQACGTDLRRVTQPWFSQDFDSAGVYWVQSCNSRQTTLLYDMKNAHTKVWNTHALIHITQKEGKRVYVKLWSLTILCDNHKWGTAQLVKHSTQKPDAILMRVHVPGTARDFFPRVSFQFPCHLGSRILSSVTQTQRLT